MYFICFIINKLNIKSKIILVLVIIQMSIVPVIKLVIILNISINRMNLYKDTSPSYSVTKTAFRRLSKQ